MAGILSSLPFADDVVLVGSNLKELQEPITEKLEKELGEA